LPAEQSAEPLAPPPTAPPTSATEAAPPAANSPAPGPGSLPADFGHSPPEDNVIVEMVKERYPNGSAKIEREVTQDEEGNYLLHGVWRSYDDKGRLIIDGRFAENRKEGLWRRFYHGDEIALLSTAPYKEFTAPFISSATFHADALHGKWTLADSKQRLVHDLEFTGGERHGKATWYHPNGSVALSALYEHGKVNGDVVQFAPDRTVLANESYQLGHKLAPKIEYFDEARQNKKQEVVYLHALLAVKTPDSWDRGTLASFESRGQDERHGPFVVWHSNGQVAKQGEYRYNLPVGKITYWFANGQKQMEGQYIDGRQEGVWTWWHENGQKAITGEYHDAVAVGQWSWWTAAGKVAQRANLSHDTAVVEQAESQSELREAKVRHIEPGLQLR
jgi:antitoxin component YwqK of YwqJK toxin-antitoxin module